MQPNYLLTDFFNKQLLALKEKKIEEYKQKSEMIIDDLLGISKAELYTNDHFISNKEIYSLEAAFSLLLEDMPVQHIIGKTYFYQDSFLTPPGVFIPRPETELLIDCIRNDFKKMSKKTVLDVGCGSGCIGITIASIYKNFEVMGIDISNKAIDVANQNALHLKIDNIKIMKQDIFKMKTKKFDIIVSNPPYISKEDPHLHQPELAKQPQIALVSGDDGLQDIRTIVGNASEYLNKTGMLLIEHGYNQANKVKQIFTDNKFNQIEQHKDINNKIRVTVGVKI